MNVLADGVAFQLEKRGLARIWTTLLGRLARIEGLSLHMLDRGHCPAIKGVRAIEFPSHVMRYTATDSLLIQDMCDKHGIDVFISTDHTTAAGTPQVQIIGDMIPGALGPDPMSREDKERRLAFSYAGHYACLSQDAHDDVRKFHPDIDPSRIVVTHCGVDPGVFNPSAARNTPSLRSEHGLTKPYVLLVGFGKQDRDDAKPLFDAVGIDQATGLDILCVGGARDREPAQPRDPSSHVRVIPRDLTDAELAAAYCGAVALVRPALRDGFGLPVMEAMACGCPVVTTRGGSPAELAGDAALMVWGQDRYEWLAALNRVQEPALRGRLIEAGLKQAARFDWDETAARIHGLLLRAQAESHDEAVAHFHRRWRKIRAAQAEVDVGVD